MNGKTYAATDTAEVKPVAPSAMQRRLFFVAVTLLFLAQVVPYLSSRWLTDESWYAATGYSIAQGHGPRNPAMGPNDLENHLDAHPPGMELAIAAAFKTLGTSAAAARVSSVLAGLAAVWLTYLLALEFLGWEGAAIAAVLMAVDNVVVITSRCARPEACTLAGVLLAALALQRYVSTNALWCAFATGLAAAAATMFHVTLLGYLVSFALLLVWSDARRRRRGFPGLCSYIAGYVLGILPFALWILTVPLGREGFHAEFMARARQANLLERVVAEGNRYHDLLGLNMLHGHGLDHVPVRIFIPLCFVVASILLWWRRRTWFYVELTLLLPSVAWFIYTVNKSSRYTALLAPIFALTIAAAVTLLRRRPAMFRLAVAAVVLMTVAQIAANAMMLRAARQANYTQVARQLRDIIPPGQAAYGTVTFWLALKDHPYISYERTEPWMAANDYGVRYFIAGDPVMRNGTRGEGEFIQHLNAEIDEIAAQSSIAGTIHDPYYGDLTVYRLQR